MGFKSKIDLITGPMGYLLRDLIDTFWTGKVSLESKGAIGDGVTNNDDAFAEAFATKRPIDVPDGVFVITDVTADYANANFVMGGTGTIKGILRVKNADSCKISGVKFTGGAGYSPNISDCNEIKISDIECYEAASGIRLENCKNGSIKGGTFRNFFEGYGISLLSTSSAGGYCANIEIIGNTLKNCAVHNLTGSIGVTGGFSSTRTTYHRNITIIGNTIIGVPFGNGVHTTQGCFGYNVSNNVIKAADDTIIETKTTGTHVLTSADHDKLFLCDCSGGDVTFTLPDAAATKFHAFYFRKESADANNVVLNRAGSDTIDSLTTKSFGTGDQFRLGRVGSDGTTDWHYNDDKDADGLTLGYSEDVVVNGNFIDCFNAKVTGILVWTGGKRIDIKNNRVMNGTRWGSDTPQAIFIRVDDASFDIADDIVIDGNTLGGGWRRPVYIKDESGTATITNIVLGSNETENNDRAYAEVNAAGVTYSYRNTVYGAGAPITIGFKAPPFTWYGQTDAAVSWVKTGGDATTSAEWTQVYP